jgi:hypothetical protein
MGHYSVQLPADYFEAALGILLVESTEHFEPLVVYHYLAVGLD